MSATPPQRHYKLTDTVDFVIIGAGASGGVLARELSRNGFSVVVLEQGPWLTTKDFTHNEYMNWNHSALTNDFRKQPTTFRKTPKDKAVKQPALVYGRMVGGGPVHFTANYWRFHEIDFIEASKKGTIAGTGFADWPITYADLEPYYTKAEWDLGVSGQAGASPFDPPRSKPYPLPPMPIKSSGVLFEQGARKLGYHPFPAPVAIISQSYQGRMPCEHCGFCMGFGCEMGAKSSPLPTMIPQAIATGRCEIRPNSYVRKIELDTQRPRDRRDLLRQERQGEPATRPGRHCGGQRLGDAAAAAALQVEPLPRRPRQLQRAGRQVPDVQHQLAGRRVVRASAERVQEHRSHARDSRPVRARSQARLLRRRRHRCALPVVSHLVRVCRIAAATCRSGAASTRRRCRSTSPAA